MFVIGLGREKNAKMQMTKEESDRIRIVKWIAIVMVVFLHAYTTEVYYADGNRSVSLPEWLVFLETGVSQIIARSGVPIFFLLSAVLLFRADRSYKDVIRKKARTLLAPYLIWNTFWIMIFLILQSLPFTAAFFSGSNKPILQCSVKEWLGLYGIGQEYPQAYPLWFMRDLMAVVLLFPLIKAAADKKPETILCIGIGLNVLPCSFFGKIALAWFLIGAAAVKKKISITVFDRYSVAKIGSLYLVLVAAALFWDGPIIRNVAVLSGIVFWLRLSKEIYVREKQRQAFLRMSEWVFIIYVLHEMTLSSVRKICFRLLPANSLFWFLEYMLIPITVMAGCILTGMVFKRLMPGLYRFSTGER